MSMSHWVFCVTRPRLEVRLRNNAVDSNASRPARSLARIERKNQARTRAPATSRPTISQPLLSAARIPVTTSRSPTADSTAPPVSKGCVGSGGSGSRTLRRLSTMIITMIRAGKTKAARQLITDVMNPPISGPAAAPTPPSALIAPNARAGSNGAQDGTDAVHAETDGEAALPAVAVGQLAARDHQRGHHQQKDRDGNLDPPDGGIQVAADVVDHHVHVRAGEATDELGEGQRDEDLSQGARWRSRRTVLNHAAPAFIRAMTAPPPADRAAFHRGQSTLVRVGGIILRA